MRYLSTRGGMEPLPFTRILLGGLAPDGGLVVPEQIPRIDDATLREWRGLSYAELAFRILSLYCDDIAADDLRAMIDRTYTAEVFGSTDIPPLTLLAERGDDGAASPLYLQHLSNGPTLAFKDLAMQLLGRLFEHVLLAEDRWLNVLGATSGDTGSAAEYAMRGKRNMRVFMLSPDGRMSRFQRAQMYSLRDPNIFNIAIDGVFDDCQDLVKAVSGDLAFKERRSPKLSHLAFLIQAGLQEHHRGATLDEAARMAASAEAIEALCATIEEDMPQGDRKETPRGNGPARPSRRGTGTRSSARRSKSG